MAKHYELVAYNYDKFARGDKYKEQIALNIPGIKFDGIEDIDRFTAGITYMEFIKYVKDIAGDRSNFSIRINDEKGNTNYRKIIFDNKELLPIINSIEKKTIYTALGYRTLKVITNRNDYFNKQFSIIENAVLNRKTEYFSSIFKNNNPLGFLLERFSNSPYDEAYNIETISEMKIAFADYKTFRKFIVGYDKYKHDTYTGTTKQEIGDVLDKKEPSKMLGSNIKENEPFKNPYMKDADLQEEFLDDNELFEMSGFDEEATPIYYTGKKR